MTMPVRERLLAHASLFMAALIWGVMSPVAKYVLNLAEVTPWLIMYVRIFVAGILFWCASFVMPGEKVELRDKLLLMFASFFAVVFNQGLFIFGVSHTSPVNASIITTLLPVTALIMSAVFLKEKPRRIQILGLVCGTAGAATLVLSGGDIKISGSFLGDLFCFIAQLSFTVYLIFYRGIIRRYKAVTLMKWLFLGAMIALSPVALPEFATFAWQNASLASLAGMGYVAVGGTFLSYLFMSVGQRRLAPTAVAAYNYVQPLSSAALAVCWGMDALTPVKCIACVLICVGVYCVTRMPPDMDKAFAAAQDGKEK